MSTRNFGLSPLTLSRLGKTPQELLSNSGPRCGVRKDHAIGGLKEDGRGTSRETETECTSKLKPCLYKNNLKNSTLFEVPDGSSRLEFNKGVIPDKTVVDMYFDNLQCNSSSGRNSCNKVGKMSYKTKWELVCEEYNAQNGVISEQNPEHIEVDLRRLLAMLQKDQQEIVSQGMWFQLEKQLRGRNACHYFIESNGIAIILRKLEAVTKETEYAYLRCFKTLISHEKGRLAILDNLEAIGMLCRFIANSEAQVRTRLLTTDMLLLLTYMDSVKVSKELDSVYALWFDTVTASINDLEQWHRSFTIQKPQQLIIDYCVSTMFLINSIVQGQATYSDKRKILVLLNDAGIHTIFRIILRSGDRLSSEILLDQVSKYRSREAEINSKCATEGQIEPEKTFETQIKTIISLTQGTELGCSMAQLVDSVMQIITFRTSAEALKLLNLLQATFDHLLENYHKEQMPSVEEALRSSISRLMDDLQAQQVNRRAVQEMEEMKQKMIEMKETMRRLGTLTHVQKYSGVGPMIRGKSNQSKKMDYIAELEEKLEAIERQRKTGNRQSAVISDESTRKDTGSLSLFDLQGASALLPYSNVARSSTIARSKRTCFASVLNAEKNRRSISGPEGITTADAENGYRCLIARSKHHRKLHETYPAPLDEQTDSKDLSAPSPVLSLASNVVGLQRRKPSTSTWDTKALPENSSKSDSSAASPNLITNEERTLQSPEALSEIEEKKEIGLASPMTPPPPPPPLPISLSATGSFRCSLQGPVSPTSQRVKLKQIHWDKIDNIKETVWNEHNERISTSTKLETFGVFKEIEDLFKVVPATPKTASSNSPTQTTRNGKIRLLSNDLAQLFGINLHIFSHYSTEELIDMVLLCHAEILQNQRVIEFFSKDDINHIPQSTQRMFAPYETNYLTGKTPDKDPAVLERADRIYLELFYNLRSYWAARSKYLLVLLTYERDYYDILYKLQRIDDATKAIRSSKKLKQLFFIIIEIGNYMNNKQALGIQLSSINKLAFTKTSKDNNLSFIHVIERIIRTRYPELHNFAEDLEKVQDMANIIVQHVQQEAQEFRERISNLERSLTVGALSDSSRFHPKDQFLSKTASSIQHARKKAELLIDQSTLTMGDFEKLVSYWGEDTKDIQSRNTFFQKFLDFVALFKKASKENIEREEIRRSQVKRVIERVPSPEKTKSVARSTPLSVGTEVDEQHAVDVLLKRLRDVRYQEPKSSKDHTEPYKSQTVRVRRQKEDGDLLSRTREMLMGVKKI
ncbi:AGL364Cp [Eremothecium gossypii ATCC 10895]|uniref:AGL364Cp n=1 Tax=Eremothecium gossypii (strain ATCC 10895 / CBS 109.51 / FGSC 9923 / NRRL Y-1056) TaxID=284811 RepID=Q751Q3_EREGS|nr:AGL364Cp [Eremothecium gossypii ATCC 10895]AAS54127.1 AGL364Cp [Eremothecium gossypii ATCC 10895]AEY98453.1 FAGL364Cp [Eremothecium gossypii FDAG1]